MDPKREETPADKAAEWDPKVVDGATSAACEGRVNVEQM